MMHILRTLFTTTSNPSKVGRPCAVEPLESRQLLSATAVGPDADAVAATTAAAKPGAVTLNKWKATVTHVADGDTFDVDIAGDGTRKTRRIRMIGIQAMEIGDAHWRKARKVLNQFIKDRKVTLMAEAEDSTGRKSRLLRYVFYDFDGNGKINKKKEDVGRMLLENGVAFAFPNAKEKWKNEAYIDYADAAAAKEIGIWADGRDDLKMWAQWDAEGNDGKNVNGEWIRIYNGGDETIDLNPDGPDVWEVRDSALNRYTFPEGAQVEPGTFITLHIGSGTDTADTFYWGLSEPIFDNVVGDGAYLVDPNGDLVAHFTYPHDEDIADPLKGKLSIFANYDPPGTDTPAGEYIEVTNISDAEINLAGYLLVSWPYSYDFGHSPELSSVLQAGETIRLTVGSGTETRLDRYWGKSTSILNNTGDAASVQTFDAVKIIEEEWG